MGSADHLRLTVKNKQRRWSSSSRVRSRFWVFPTFTQTVIWVAVVGLHLWNWKHTRKKIETVTRKKLWEWLHKSCFLVSVICTLCGVLQSPLTSCSGYMEPFAFFESSRGIEEEKGIRGLFGFPYTTVERLLWELEKMNNSGWMLEQCQKLKEQLHQALRSHLKLVIISRNANLV